MSLDLIIIYLKDHLFEIIGLLITFFGIIVPLYKFLRSKNIEEKDKIFHNFHKLIKELVQPDEKTGSMKQDRQIAIIFELRNLKDYYPVTERILEGLKEHWKEYPKMIEEINLTLKYIDDYNKKWYKKIKRK